MYTKIEEIHISTYKDWRYPMRTKKAQKLMIHTKKSVRIFLIPCIFTCILYSGCGQASSKEIDPKILSPQAMPTQVPEATPTPTSGASPTAIATQTAAPTPTNTPIPTPIYTFLPPPDAPDKTSLLDYITQEEIDTIFSSSYDPDTTPQLFARYRGHLRKPNYYQYCIDLFLLNDFSASMLVNIKIYKGSYQFIKYGDAKLLQNLYYFVCPSVEPEHSAEPFQSIDLNNDQYDDFLFNLGSIGNGRNQYSLAFIYDAENDGYVFLGEFLNATYMPEKQMIYEEHNRPMGESHEKNKYIISDTKTILVESICILDDSYTYQKLIEGELTTILKDATYEEICEIIDFNSWSSTYSDLK